MELNRVKFMKNIAVHIVIKDVLTVPMIVLSTPTRLSLSFYPLQYPCVFVPLF